MDDPLQDFKAQLKKVASDAEQAKLCIAAALEAVQREDFATAQEILHSNPVLLDIAREFGFEGEIQELLRLVDGADSDLAEEEGEFQPPPALSLTAIELDVFNPFQDSEMLDAWGATLVAHGYEACGVWFSNELPIGIRSFYLAPATWGIIYQFGGQVNWIDIVRRFADGTHETWSNAPMHDGLSPPWSTLHVDAEASVEQLVQRAAGSKSSKPLAHIRSEDFESDFLREYARDQAWRAEQA